MNTAKGTSHHRLWLVWRESLSIPTRRGTQHHIDDDGNANQKKEFHHGYTDSRSATRWSG